MALAVLLIIELDIRDVRLTQQLIPLLHLSHKRLEHYLGLVSLLHDCVFLLLSVVIGRENGQIMMQQAAVVREFDHLRVDEDELQL